MVYSSGFLTNRDFLRTGLPMTIIATAVVLFLSQVYWPMVAPTPP
jgi:di/tricarboxylate transporter